MPKFTLDKLNKLVGLENEQTLQHARDTRTPELTTVLGGLGLGELRLPGIDTDQGDASHADDHSPRTQGLDMIADLEIKQLFEKSIAASRTLYERVGIIAPDIGDLITKGVDFSGLADIYQAERDGGREPELVYAPINVAWIQVKNLFANLCHDATIPNNPLQTHSGGSDGVLVTREVMANWKSLTGSIVLPSIELVVGQTQYDSWSLRIVPSSSFPVIQGVDYEGVDENGHLIPIPYHPTIPEYVTLQGTHIQDGLGALDYGTYATWLSGSFEHKGESIAPYGCFVMGRVAIAAMSQDEIRSGLGVRPVHW